MSNTNSKPTSTSGEDDFEMVLSSLDLSQSIIEKLTKQREAYIKLKDEQKAIKMLETIKKRKKDVMQALYQLYIQWSSLCEEMSPDKIINEEQFEILLEDIIRDLNKNIEEQEQTDQSHPLIEPEL